MASTRTQADAPTRTSRRRVLAWTAGVLLLPSLLGTALRLVPPRTDPPALLASFIPYAVLGYGGAVLCLLAALASRGPRGRVGVATVVTALLLSVHLAWLGPLFVRDDRPPVTPAFTLLSLNMLNGTADLGSLAAAAEGVDVVVLLETTPEAMARLDSPQWRQRFPYRAGDLDDLLEDSVIFSRFPLSGTALVDSGSFGQWFTTLSVPSVGDVGLVAVHPCNPLCGHDLFATEHDALTDLAQQHLDRPLVLAGDFNAVDDHGGMQDLYALGLTSATDLVGAGWLPTYPASRVLPPLLPIDHVLLDAQLTATATRTVRVRGTDHLGLVTSIARAG